MSDKAQEILVAYTQMVENTQEALRLANVPEPVIVSSTINLPDFRKMIPEDVVKLYRDMRKLVVIHLFQIGLTQGEIARRLGGNSYHIVQQILKEWQEAEKVKLATREEVSETEK